MPPPRKSTRISIRKAKTSTAKKTAKKVKKRTKAVRKATTEVPSVPTVATVGAADKHCNDIDALLEEVRIKDANISSTKPKIDVYCTGNSDSYVANQKKQLKKFVEFLGKCKFIFITIAIAIAFDICISTIVISTTLSHTIFHQIDPEYKFLTNPVPNPAGFGEDEVAYVYTMLASKKTPSSLKLFNKLVTEWQLSITMDKPDKVSGCPYPQASSMNSNRRAFFSGLKNFHLFQMGSEDIRGFPGAFHGNMKAEYAKRIAKWVSNDSLLLHDKKY